MLSLTLIWLALLVIFAIAEGVTVGLVSIWFAIGALAAMLVSLAVKSLLVQVIVFAVASIISMAIIRPLAKKYFTPKTEELNARRIIGTTGIVTESVDPLEGTGLVKVEGKVWTARSADGIVIPEGTLVTIRDIQGVKVLVIPANVPAAQGD